MNDIPDQRRIRGLIEGKSNFLFSRKIGLKLYYSVISLLCNVFRNIIYYSGTAYFSILLSFVVTQQPENEKINCCCVFCIILYCINCKNWSEKLIITPRLAHVVVTNPQILGDFGRNISKDIEVTDRAKTIYETWLF